jgi:hypothetical protein
MGSVGWATGDVEMIALIISLTVCPVDDKEENLPVGQ